VEEFKPHQEQLAKTHFPREQKPELQIKNSKSGEHFIARNSCEAERKPEQQEIESDTPSVKSDPTSRKTDSDLDPQSIVGYSGEFAALENPSTLIDTVSVTLDRPNTAIHSLSSYPFSEKAKQLVGSLKSIPVPILVVDEAHVVRYANLAFHRTLEHRENIAGLRLTDVFPIDYENRTVLTLMEKARMERNEMSREGYFRVLDRRLWAQLNISFVESEETKLWLIVLQSLKAAKQLLGMWKFKKLINIVPIGIAEFVLENPTPHDLPEEQVLDAIYSARLVDGNNEYARMWGKSDIRQIVGNRAIEFAADKNDKLNTYSMWIRKFFPTGSFEIKDKGSNGHTQFFEQTLIGEVKDGHIVSFWELRQNTTNKRLSEKKLRNSLGKLKRTLRATVEAIGSVAEKRDPYTAGHQKRVAEIAYAIAHEMGLSEDHCTGIHLAASIHDIGKIYVPAEFLSKPGTMSEAEKLILRTHPTVGYDILKGIEFPWPIAQIILQHHERMDGSGYPEGLTGDTILFEAKIVGVADVVEAMSSHRPYRPSLGMEEALREITEHKGTLYDSDVVNACLTLANKGFIFE
jgi:putative nucleotidyltransferase with HDIG domain